MLAHGGALRSAEESLGRDEATGLQAQWLKTNLWRVGDYGFRNAIPCDTHGSHLPLWYCEKQYCLHAVQDFPWVCLRACFFSFCAERTTLFNLHTTPGHLTLNPKKHAVEQKTIFWHEESIVLQLSFLWYQTVGNQVVPTRNGWSRSWVPGEDPKRTWRNYSWMWEICVLADVDVLFFNLRDFPVKTLPQN